MLSDESAKRLVHVKGRTRAQQLLLLLAVGAGAKPVNAIRKTALSCGLRAAARWNLSDMLRKSDGCAIHTGSGWELTDGGREAVAVLANVRLPGAVVKKVVADVRHNLDRIISTDARNFIEEAISCFEHGQFRAAVVFSWVGAISLIHLHVVKNVLGPFNAEARRRDPKWRDARNGDEIGRMKEHDFLDVLEAIGSVGKNVKQALQNQCLQLRNACGHPTSLKITENNVASHLDTLVLNVYSVF